MFDICITSLAVRCIESTTLFLTSLSQWNIPEWRRMREWMHHICHRAAEFVHERSEKWSNTTGCGAHPGRRRHQRGARPYSRLGWVLSLHPCSCTLLAKEQHPLEHSTPDTMSATVEHFNTATASKSRHRHATEDGRRTAAKESVTCDSQSSWSAHTAASGNHPRRQDASSWW